MLQQEHHTAISLLCYTFIAAHISWAVHTIIHINIWSKGISSSWSVWCIPCQGIKCTG